MCRVSLSRDGQVKMLSVLAYFVSKNFVDVLRAYESLPTHIMQLLASLPPDSLAVRRELIIAARHFLSSDLRAHFLPHIELLLNESTLLGIPSRTYTRKFSLLMEWKGKLPDLI